MTPGSQEEPVEPIRSYDLTQGRSVTRRPNREGRPPDFLEFLAQVRQAQEARVRAPEETPEPLRPLPRPRYPEHAACFLPQHRRPARSPMRVLRLGGLLKAAARQLRLGVPASGIG